MLRWEVLLAVGLVLATVPGAQAADSPSCDEVTDEDAVRAEDHYARVSEAERIEGWQEDNGVDGLQTTACEDANGGEHPADTHVVTLPDYVMPLVDAVVGFAEFLVDFATGLLDGCQTFLGQKLCLFP